MVPWRGGGFSSVTTTITSTGYPGGSSASPRSSVVGPPKYAPTKSGSRQAYRITQPNPAHRATSTRTAAPATAGAGSGTRTELGRAPGPQPQVGRLDALHHHPGLVQPGQVQPGQRATGQRIAYPVRAGAAAAARGAAATGPLLGQLPVQVPLVGIDDRARAPDLVPDE